MTIQIIRDAIRDDSFYIKTAWIWIVGFSLFRLLYSGAFLLAPDEANYWQWSRHMAWGYHDQAPMIAWAIRLATFLFGHTETVVRLPSILAMAIASAYMVAIAGRWISSRAAFHTAILSQAILEFNIGGLLATPDGLQAVAWAGASYHVAVAFEENRWSQWLKAGLWFGFGMLSKYTMVIFLPSVYLYGLLSQVHRKRLAGIRPYIGLLLGTIMFLPVIYWNAKNSWNSVRHVAFLGGANEQFTIHLNFFGDYFASQAGLLSPLVFLLILLAWPISLSKRFRTEKWIYAFLFFTSCPMVAGFAVLSLHTRVYGNWPGAGFLTASILIAAFFAGKANNTLKNSSQIINYIGRIGRKTWPWAVGTSYLLTALVLIQVIWPVMPIPTGLDRTSTEIQGWKNLGQTAGEMVHHMPNPGKTFLFGLRYQTASELAFYAPGKPLTVSINKWKRPNVYDYWWKDDDLIGWDAVGVTYDSQSHTNRLYQVFEHVDPPLELKIYRDSVFKKKEPIEKPVKILYLYRAYGFKGGLRWAPPYMSDIRAN